MRLNKVTQSNGLRVVTVPMADNPSVTVLVMVEAGSKYEDKSTSGLSHFLEHMVFKGTPTRPKAVDISRELDGIGAQYNAFTTQEFTGYYAKADARHLDRIIDIVSDMYLHPLFEESEIAKEKGVIVEEIRMYQDLPQRHVHDVLMDLVYGDQPVGWNIAGTIDNVRSFKRDQFIVYRDAHYVSKKTVVIVSGSFKENEIMRKIEKSFSSISKDKASGKVAVKESQTVPQVKVEYKETDQTHLVLGMRTFDVTDPRTPAMLVLSTVLGRGMSSRLFSKLRDEMGICYYVRTEQNAFTDHGLLTISVGLDNSRVEEGVKVILAECSRMKHEPVSPAELKKAKDYIAGTTMLELETSEARAEYCGLEEILKKAIELPDDLIKKVSAVTAAEVQKLAGRIFVDAGLNMAVIGKFNGEEGFKRYLKFD